MHATILMFDGTNEDKIKEFFEACDFAYKIIRPEDKAALTEAIRCTKLKA